MNTDSCDMIRVADDDAVHEGVPGSFCVETLASGQRVMWHKLPDGNGGLLRLRPVVSGEQHPSWEWDGNEEKPTLTPSVHLPGRWHGWFRAGRMISC
jgi:hypothetical protein